MFKRIVALLLCVVMLVSGCGKSSSGSTESNGGNNTNGGSSQDEHGEVVVQMVPDEFHGITYQVPNTWVKDAQIDSDAVYYAPTGDNDDIIIMLLYTDFTGKNVYSVYDINQVYEKMIEGLKNTEGISELKEEYKDLNGTQVAVAEYDQVSGEDSFSAVQYFFAIPVYEGLFTCGYVVRKGIEDDYRDDYMNLIESITMPVIAS